MADDQNDSRMAFAFVINEHIFNGKVDYSIHSDTRAIRDELVIAMVEAWLRGVKDHYYEQIRSRMSF